MVERYNDYAASGLRPLAVLFDLTESTEDLPFAEEFAESVKGAELKVRDVAADARETLTERLKVMAGELVVPVFNCVVVTDRDDGIAAALSAGMVALGVANTELHQRLAKADMVLSTFEGADRRVVFEVFAHARKIPL